MLQVLVDRLLTSTVKSEGIRFQKQDQTRNKPCAQQAQSNRLRIGLIAATMDPDKKSHARSQIETYLTRFMPVPFAQV